MTRWRASSRPTGVRQPSRSPGNSTRRSSPCWRRRRGDGRQRGKNMATPILVTGAAGRVGAIGRTVTELLLKRGEAVRAMVRNEDERAQALSDAGAEVVV